MLDADSRHAVADVLHRYATALDTRSYEDLRHVFAPDGVADYGALGGVREGADAIIRFCRRALGGFAAVQHFICNIVIAPDGEHISATSYFLAFHVIDGQDGGQPFTVGGVYQDRLVGTDGRWRIAHRTLMPVWQSGAPQQPQVAQEVRT
jgi:3-phenylpropionate/cinnamic acid dioxygenase small subunit